LYRKSIPFVLSEYHRFHLLFTLLFVWACGGEVAGAKDDPMAVAVPKISPVAGFYSGPQVITLKGEGNYFYTLDGSTPTAKSNHYEHPLTVERTTLFRVAAFGEDGKRTSYIVGGTYFINEPETRLATLSVGIDPWRLFDQNRGWFMAGPGADPGHWKKPGANWWTKREHPVHFDFIEEEESVFSGTVGFRMFGGMSRLEPQKSFSISTRSRYGKKRIKHPIFGEKENDSFRFLVARNGGSDWGKSYIRDALLTGLLQDESWDLERQAARPVQVYLNGKYWGIYHLREKINPQYLEDRSGVDKDSLDLLEHQETVKHGSLRQYRKMLQYLENNDPADPAVFYRLEKLMDVDNFQRLQIAQTYFDNRDAGGNIRFWRPHRPEGRWRWILYDVDQGFGLHRDSAYLRNTLAFYTATDGPSWPNPPWSTLILRQLLRNENYRNTFVNRSLEYLATDFSTERVLAAIEDRRRALEYDMPRHWERWRGREKNWRIHLERLREFSRHRPHHLREHLRTFFAAGDDRRVTVAAGEGGWVEVSGNLLIGSEGLEIDYFSGIPLHLRAVAKKGYRFAGWQDLEEIRPEFEQRLDRDQPHRFRALFEPNNHPLADQLIISEVHPTGGAAGDWLELHNRSQEAVDVRDWLVTDGGGGEMRLPAVVIPSDGYLILCEDEERFREVFPGTDDVVGNLPFGLNKRKETLGLYSRRGAYVNAVAYKLEGEQPEDFSYLLALPGLDNQDQGNWLVQEGDGFPLEGNPEGMSTAVITPRDYWTRIIVGVSVLLLIIFWRTRKGASKEATA
jgi:hypothetical protein